MLTKEQLAQVAEKNIENLVKKVAEGKPLSDRELSMLEAATGKEPEQAPEPAAEPDPEPQHEHGPPPGPEWHTEFIRVQILPGFGYNDTSFGHDNTSNLTSENRPTAGLNELLGALMHISSSGG